MRVSCKNYFWLWWWRQWNLPEMSFILISCKIIRSGIFVIIMLLCWWVAKSRVSCKNYFWLWRWRQGNLPEMSFILISWKKENIPSYFALWLALLSQKGLKDQKMPHLWLKCSHSQVSTLNMQKPRWQNLVQRQCF